MLPRVPEWVPPPPPPMIRQEAQEECGLACLAMVLHSHGRPIGLDKLRRVFPASMWGASMTTLMDISRHVGFHGRGLQCALHELPKLLLPCILHWKPRHCVVLKKVTDTHITINDPAVGVRTLSMADAGREFTGIALELIPPPDFKERPLSKQIRSILRKTKPRVTMKKTPRRLSIWSAFRWIFRIGRSKQGRKKPDNGPAS